MKAVILSGGEGTRLKSVSGGLPKPMMPLLGKPLLEHIVALLRENGFDELYMTLRYRPETIRDHFRDGSRFGVHIEYRVEEQALGTAGAVKNCAGLLGEEPFLVMSGDCVCDFDLRGLMARHRGGATIALSAHTEPLAYGLVVTDAAGHVRGFVEKPTWERVVTDRVSTGVYILSPEVLALIPAGQPFDFAKDLFPLMLERGVPLNGVEMEGYWCDIGDPRAYYRCNLDALDGKCRLPQETQAAACVLPCRDRARLMRLMSQTLVEAGAELTDGLTLTDGRGRAHLAPLADRCALALEGDPEAVRAMAALARKLERDSG